MQKFRRGLAAAVLLAVVPAVSAVAAQAPATTQAQPTPAPAPARTQTPPPATGGVGPAELRNFTLPGERTTPPAPVQQPAPRAETPPPASTRPTTTRPAEQRPAQTRPAAETPRAAAPAPVRDAAPAAGTPPPASETPAATTSEPSAAAPVAVEPLPTTVEPQQQPAAQAAPQPAQGGGWSPWWLALPAVLALAGFVALRRRRSADEDYAESTVEPEAEEPEAMPAEAPRAAAEPAPRRSAESIPPAPRPAAKPALKLPPKVRVVPAAPAAPPEPVGPRAVLEIQFIPARASATEDAAVVEFELVLKNVGDAPAGNIRIDTRMFNASATKEMADFLKGPIHETSGSPHVQIAPGDELRLQSAMAMPKQDVREIMMQGQRLFVPAVASVFAWDWGTDGRGRATMSWLVGRETENKAAKMGAFRLDLGPRIYRQVGVRPLKLVA
ncbi:MAG TPA: hypothetical protein VF680_10325 [Allosphingosinicella sp.]|jgi:hypothetical protein